ncbi:MAG: diguanylate cyclase [Campylobacterota bacterium]|nr:diguanylate cyclase [Campylobacterota bacterium]
MNKILVVDDSINNLDILVELLSEYDVIDTTSGIEAIEILEEERVDLILLDIMMPDMNGFEVCEKLKTNPKTGYTPIIFITSKTDEASIEKAYDIGGIDYIAKPFKAKELLAKVQRELKLNSLIVELKNSKAELEKLASTDHLTKLYNRRYFLDVAEHTLDLASRDLKKLSIAMLDIDKFKLVNDNYGHQVGDDVLVMVSNVLRNNMRKSDLLCRFGGEEFIILLPETCCDDSKIVADKLREKIESEVIELEDGRTLQVTGSFGISSLIHEKDTILEQIIARADEALYDAKETGRSKVCIR